MFVVVRRERARVRCEDVFAEYIIEQPTPLFSQFVMMFMSWEVIVIALLGAFAVYDPTANGGFNAENAQSAFNNVYPLYQDVDVIDLHRIWISHGLST